MDKVYNPKNIEAKWYEMWEQSNAFKPKGKLANYCIMIPPPNVTGTLHMGHAFQDTLMDILIRYHRMRGHKTLWQMGTDHAGIATQMVVERQLEARGKSRKEMSREKFIDKIWEWKNHSGNKIANQLRRIGASVDWSRERFTMDPELSEAVTKVFVNLYREGLIYRGKRLVNWDPILQSAVSDLEVVNEETTGTMWDIKYPLTDGSGFITISTTRPETMLGDAAVAVHPSDERYQELIGRTVHLPLVNREIPIIADEHVDPEFGSGCVKITPGHDFNDYEVGLRHQLPQINIFTPTAHINSDMPAKYQGLERFAARKEVLHDLTNEGLLLASKDHQLNLPKGDRTKTILEPMLTDQWFIAIEELAKPAIAAVKSGEIKFIPENWSKTYFQWMENIKDWCISRQLWWGHRIPAWYDTDGNTYVGVDELDVRKHYKLKEEVLLNQDPDVLDTWFSSALWPFSTLGWPKETKDLETFYPTNVLVTGFDIIFFWVARMIMFGLKFTGKIPFRQVYIHGLIVDNEGQKMSKSKGNGIDPLDIIDGISLQDLLTKRTSSLMQPQMRDKISKKTKAQFPEGIPAYGTDALRFTFCALATTARQIRFDLTKVESYRNFCNKLWNASRFVSMQVENEASNLMGPKVASVCDQWITSCWQHTLVAAEKHIANFRFDLLASDIYEFTWNKYCDWYLELVKPILSDPNAASEVKRATRHTLLTILEEILCVLHPIMPFITEEIWQKLSQFQISEVTNELITHPFPKAKVNLIKPDAEAEIVWLQKFITAVRTLKAEMNIAPNKQVNLQIKNASDLHKQMLVKMQPFLKLAAISKIDYLGAEQVPPAAAASALIEEFEIFLPLADLIDVTQEKNRLQREITKLKQDLTKTEVKLNNPNYVQKAPKEVVAKEQEKAKQFNISLEKLINNLESLNNLQEQTEQEETPRTSKN